MSNICPSKNISQKKKFCSSKKLFSSSLITTKKYCKKKKFEKIFIPWEKNRFLVLWVVGRVTNQIDASKHNFCTIGIYKCRFQSFLWIRPQIGYLFVVFMTFWAIFSQTGRPGRAWSGHDQQHYRFFHYFICKKWGSPKKRFTTPELCPILFGLLLKCLS